MATLTSTAKVLTIGEPKEVFKYKSPAPKLNAINLYSYCANHFRLVLLGSPTPIEGADGLCPIEWFGMETISKQNQPTCYQFHCFPSQKAKPKHVNIYYFYQTINANAILRDVRLFLKDEHWRSKNVLMGPLKGKLNPSDGRPEQSYIERAISKAFDIERAKVFPYMIYLHREYVQNKNN